MLIFVRMPLPTDLFDYPLPANAIAQHPADKRDHSRLMVVRRATRTVEHLHFYDLPAVLATLGHPVTLFRNTAKVIRARLYLKKESGTEVELLLLRPAAQTVDNQKPPSSAINYLWWCLARPLKKLSINDILIVDNEPVATLREKSDTGEALFEFHHDPLKLAERVGVLPLPPYIARKPHDINEKEDNERYQTVYAKEPVAAAAPTAGLHFTPLIIKELQNNGHRFVDVSLHVGLDTFRPITAENVEAHKIHTETYEVSPEAVKSLINKEKNKEFRLAIGTTSLRSMEDFSRKNFPEGSHHGASIYIYPPQTIGSVDSLLTNFHLPKSTLLCLVSAFLTPGSTEGINWLKSLYAEALEKGYRFYSYGDAMLIL